MRAVVSRNPGAAFFWEPRAVGPNFREGVVPPEWKIDMLYLSGCDKPHLSEKES